MLGNIGTTILQKKNIRKIINSYDYIIFELSSYQLDKIKYLKLNIGCITNLYPDHLKYHLNFKKYIETKLYIKNLLKSKGRVLINAGTLKVIDYKKAYNYTSKYVSDTTTYIMRINGIINCAEFIDKKNSENFYLYYTYVKIKYNGTIYDTIVPIIALPYKCKTGDCINMYGIYLEYINLGAYVNKLIEYTSQIISKTNINYINSRYSYIGTLWKDLYPFKNNSELRDKIVNEYDAEFNVFI